MHICFNCDLFFFANYDSCLMNCIKYQKVTQNFNIYIIGRQNILAKTIVGPKNKLLRLMNEVDGTGCIQWSETFLLKGVKQKC